MGAGGAEEKKASEDWCGAGIAAARRTLTGSSCEKHVEQMGDVVSHICTVHDRGTMSQVDLPYITSVFGSSCAE